MDKIRIVSWFLTRRCNLQCSYCAIVRNYKGKPDEYPDMKHYYKNEMKAEEIIEALKKFKLHNPDCFHIFYGGEPFMRSDLPAIINFCNSENIQYTIITNNTADVHPMIEDLLLSTDYVVGLTSSIDPLIVSDETDSDRKKKSFDGLKQLMSYKGIINDLVAEITVDNRNVKYLYQLVKTLTDFGINSDITVIDIAKNNYYDFSNVNDSNLLVGPSDEIKREFDRILDDDSLDIHMKHFLLPEILKILPSELDCNVPLHPHNMTIDADGTIRLCLRIRGTETPKHLNIKNVFYENGELHAFYKAYTKIDKSIYCRKCNWTCILMSNKINKDDDTKDLIHLAKREGLKHGR